MLEESVTNPSIWASMNSWFTPTVLFVLLNLMIGTILFSSNLSNPPKHQENQEKDQGSNQQNDPQNPKLLKSPSVLQRLKSNINIKHFRSQEASFLKQTLDSNTHYPSEILTQELQSAIETHTSYIFQETLHQETLSTETHFVFEQLNEENVQFPETHESEDPKSETHESEDPKSETHESEDPKSETQFEEIYAENQPEKQRVSQDLDEVYSRLGQFVDADSNFIRTKSDTKPASGEVPAKLPQKMKKSASMKSAFAHFEENDIVETLRPATVRERRKAKALEPDEEVDAKADDFINKFKQQLKLQRMDSILRYKEEVVNRGSAK